MSFRGGSFEELKYRLILILPRSQKVLVLPTGNGDCLPTVHIPQGTRVAKELQKEIRDLWRLDVIFLDLLPPEDGYLPCAIAEVVRSQGLTDFVPVGTEQLLDVGLGEALLARLVAAFKEDSFSNGPFSRVG